MMKQNRTLVQLVLFFISNIAFATVRLEYETKVIDVIDGKTVVVSNKVSKTGIEISSAGTLELDGIDAPDLDQPGGKMAHECLKCMVNGQAVTIIEVSDNGHSRGGWIFRRDQTNCVNLLMVQKGMAWWKKTESHVSSCVGQNDECAGTSKSIQTGPVVT